MTWLYSDKTTLILTLHTKKKLMKGSTLTRINVKVVLGNRYIKKILTKVWIGHLGLMKTFVNYAQDLIR
jgi:hypothetical protein